MALFLMNQIPVEAVQFTGDNWAEMHDFTGHFVNGEGYGQPRDVFDEIGNALPENFYRDAVAEIWVESMNLWHPVRVNDWIVRGPVGFTSWGQKNFSHNFTEISDPPYIEWNNSEPTTPGFYYNHRSSQSMLYLLDRDRQWWAIVDNGTIEKCVWSYIEQTIQVYPLRRVGT